MASHVAKMGEKILLARVIPQKLETIRRLESGKN
jgi:hypothetical protein